MSRLKELSFKEMQLWGLRALLALLLLWVFSPLLSNVRIEIFGDFFLSHLPDPFKSLSMWSEDNFGTNSVIGTWRAFPLGIIFYFFGTLLNIPLQFVQFSVVLSLFAVGMVGFVKVAREIYAVKSDHQAVLYAGAVLYVFNPFTLIQLLNSFVQVIPHLLMPFAFLLFIRVMHRQNTTRNILVLSAICSLVFAVNLVFGVIYYCLFASYSLWQIIKLREWSFWRFIYTTSLSLFITILLSAWWLAPMLITNFLDSGTAQYVLSSETFYNKETSVSHLLRQLGDWGFFGSHAGTPFFDFAKDYKSNPLIIFSGFGLTFTALLALFRLSNKRQRMQFIILYFAILLIVLLPIMGGTHPSWPTSGLMQWLYENIPYANIFRNSYKWMSVFILCLSMLLVAFFLGVRKQYAKTSTVLISLVWVAVVVYAFPFFNGEAFPQSRIFNGLPEGWRHATDELKKSKQPGIQRLLLLPNQYFSAYKWNGERKGFRHLEPDIIDVPVVRNTCAGCSQLNTSKILTFLYGNLAEKNIFKLASGIGVSHIFQRNDFDHKYYNVESPEKIKTIINNHPEISLQKSFDKLDLYKIDDSLVNKILYSPNKITSTRSLNDMLKSFDSVSPSGKDNAFVLTEQSDSRTLQSSNYFQPLFNTSTSIDQKNMFDQADVPNDGEYNVARKELPKQVFSASYTSSGESYKITIQSLPEDLKVGGEVLYSNEGSPSREIDLGAPTTKPLVIEIGDQAFYLENGKQDELLGQINLEPQSEASINIYEAATQQPSNLMRNSSFENGFWRDDVENCDLKTDEAKISMFASNDSTEGLSSLGLTAGHDTACTFSEPVKDFQAGAVYLLSFDAKNLSGVPPAFCVWDGTGCSTYQKLKSSRDWQTSHSVIKLGSDAKIFQLYLYSHKGNTQETTNLYDNIRLYRLGEKTATLPLPVPSNDAPTSFNVNLKAGINDFSTQIVRSENNLIENGSFEDDAWGNGRVTNCRDYGANPTLEMKRVEDATDGKQSLELFASKEAACVSSEVLSRFNRSQIYSMAFDYKVIEGQDAQICVWDGKTCILDQKITPKTNSWQHFESIVRPTSSSQFLSIYLYAPGGQSSSRVRYDSMSVRVIENPVNLYSLLGVNSSPIEPAQISSFKEMGHTKFSAQIKLKPASKSLAIFQQSYHLGWNAYIKKTGTNDRIKIDNNDHIIANGFANGWWIDHSQLPQDYQDADLELIIEYTPQRWFYIGSFFSGLTLLGATGYLTYRWWHRRSGYHSTERAA